MGMKVLCIVGKSLFQPFKAALVLGNVEEALAFLKRNDYKGEEIRVLEAIDERFGVQRAVFLTIDDERERFITEVLKE